MPGGKAIVDRSLRTEQLASAEGQYIIVQTIIKCQQDGVV